MAGAHWRSIQDDLSGAVERLVSRLHPIPFRPWGKRGCPGSKRKFAGTAAFAETRGPLGRVASVSDCGRSPASCRDRRRPSLLLPFSVEIVPMGDQPTRHDATLTATPA